MPVVEWCVSGAKGLRFVGREFHQREEEVRNDQSANLAWWRQIEWKDTDDPRNEFCWKA